MPCMIELLCVWELRLRGQQHCVSTDTLCEMVALHVKAGLCCHTVHNYYRILGSVLSISLHLSISVGEFCPSIPPRDVCNFLPSFWGYWWSLWGRGWGWFLDVGSTLDRGVLPGVLSFGAGVGDLFSLLGFFSAPRAFFEKEPGRWVSWWGGLRAFPCAAWFLSAFSSAIKHCTHCLWVVSLTLIMSIHSTMSLIKSIAWPILGCLGSVTLFCFEAIVAKHNEKSSEDSWSASPQEGEWWQKPWWTPRQQ